MANIYHKQYLVGQGGLHLGIIDDYAYIYDCGGYGRDVDTKQIFSEIKLKISTCKKLYIFISHWHEDHCNYLQKLLDEISQYVSKISVYSPTMNNLETPDKNTINLEKIMFVCEQMIDHKNQYDADFTNLVVNGYVPERENVTYENDFSNLPAELPDNQIWKPYITHIDIADSKKFNEKLYEILPKDLYYGVNHLEKMVRDKDFWKNCLIAYKQTFHFQNVKNVNHKNMLCLYCGQTICSNEFYENWLHTGDALMRSKKQIIGFMINYGCLLEYVTHFQIPHHGSRANHDHKFSRYFHRCYREFFITAQENPSKASKEVKPYLDDIVVCRWKPIAKISEKLKSYIFSI